MTANDGDWERETIRKLALAALAEQRARRRWGIFFKLATLAFLFLVAFASLGWIGEYAHPCASRCTALIDIRGTIDNDGPASAENIVSALQSAMDHKGVRGVVLRFNSPGGSAVQAGIVNDEIRRLRALHPDTPVYAVVEDLAASAAYYIAVAADQIFVDKASMVGSIGVLMDGFGFTGAMEKLGVERRLITAGERKGFLDPFSQMTELDRQFAQRLLDGVHAQFVEVVRKGRGERLKESPETFSGLVWTGQEGVALGLADALGSLDSVARDVIKAEDIVDFTLQENLAERFAKRFGAAVGRSVAAAVRSAGISVR